MKSVALSVYLFICTLMGGKANYRHSSQAASVKKLDGAQGGGIQVVLPD